MAAIDWEDGACGEVYFLAVPESRLQYTLLAIQASASVFEIAPCWMEEEGKTVSDIPDAILKLRSGALANCGFIYATSDPGFDARVQLYAERVGEQFDLNAVWWPQDVFPDWDTEIMFRVAAIYFIHLYHFLGAPRFFFGGGSGSPRTEPEQWHEV